MKISRITVRVLTRDQVLQNLSIIAISTSACDERMQPCKVDQSRPRSSNPRILSRSAACLLLSSSCLIRVAYFPFPNLLSASPLSTCVMHDRQWAEVDDCRSHPPRLVSLFHNWGFELPINLPLSSPYPLTHSRREGVSIDNLTNCSSQSINFVIRFAPLVFLCVREECMRVLHDQYALRRSSYFAKESTDIVLIPRQMSQILRPRTPEPVPSFFFPQSFHALYICTHQG